VTIIDADPRERLLKKIAQLGPVRYPVVPLEDFFEGNSAPGSIGCNLRKSENPGIAGFFQALKEIRDRPDVQDVLVEIYEMPEDVTTWPFVSFR
jgi:hypothetical protein